MPNKNEMVAAFLTNDASYEGIFVTAVKTTGIFCRPTCSARKPKPENVEFYASPRDALASGYRSCKRCEPMKPIGATPDWLDSLFKQVEKDVSRRWKDNDLREMGLEPERVRRWFKNYHKMTFHAYIRARRLALALGRINDGETILNTALNSGYKSLSGFNEAFSNMLGISPGESKSARVVSVGRITTLLGPMIAAATDEALCLLEFTDRRMLETQLKRLKKQLNCIFVSGKNKVLAQLENELGKYFKGELQQFSVPFLISGTAFQERVWQELQRIPYGNTSTYAELANKIHNPAAVRAVGRANGLNRIAILIPCHRVIGSDGSMTGYGGGIWRKKRMLELENRNRELMHRE